MPTPPRKPSVRIIHAIISISLLVAICALAACTKPAHTPSANWTLTPQQRDSIRFSQTHHYNVGYNFILTSDTLLLLPSPEGMDFNLDYVRDSAVLRAGDDFVVTDIYRVDNPDSVRTDSVWLRIGTYGAPLGWVGERQVLDRATPVDPISRFIHFFSGSHLMFFYGIVLIVAIIIVYRLSRHKRIWLVHFHDIPSPYPTAFCVSMATAAILYATIQMFWPDMWEEFYFHPSLNPLGHPFVLSLFLVLVWLSVILLLSVVFDLHDKLSFSNLLSYFAGLLAWGGLLYIVLTLTTKIYVGYAIYVLYVIFAIARYLANNRSKPAGQASR